MDRSVDFPQFFFCYWSCNLQKKNRLGESTAGIGGSCRYERIQSLRTYCFSKPKAGGNQIILFDREESEEQPSRVEFDGRCVSLMSESMVVSEGIAASRSNFDSLSPTSAGKLGVPERAFSAAGATFLSAILVNPLDVAKVLQGLEYAFNFVEDTDEWLGIFNVKLRHMREDIESIETRNNKLEMQYVNNKSSIEELDRLLERLCIPS